MSSQFIRETDAVYCRLYCNACFVLPFLNVFGAMMSSFLDLQELCLIFDNGMVNDSEDFTELSSNMWCLPLDLQAYSIS